MAAEVVAQVGEDPFPGPAGEVGLRVGRDDRADSRCDEEPRDQPERVRIVAPDAAVEGELREVGRRERSGRGGEQERDRERSPQLVRSGESRKSRDAPRRCAPGPVLDLGVARTHQVSAGLMDSHAVASIRAANSFSSRPCS